MADIFALAAKQKLRFITSRGQLSAEDLWDLPLTSPSGKNVNLDDVARSIFKELKDSEEVSFVEDSNSKKAAGVLALKLEIAKFVIADKKADRDAAEKAASDKAQREKILEIIANKKDKALEEKSLEDLQAMLNK